MKILVVGGGSGGHITPVLAVASEIKRINPSIKIVYVGQKGDNLSDVAKTDSNVDKFYAIRSGKFRRYNESLIKQLLDIKTVLKNIRDIFLFVGALFQSYLIIIKEKPSIVFSRGSYVAVPVSLAAHLKKIPYVTHDSDPIPSLSNKILSKWAKLHLTALPEEIYPYPRENTINTGIPLSKKFVQVNKKIMNDYRKELKIPSKSKVLLVIGGGLGAEEINLALKEIAEHLLYQHKDLYIFNIVGLKNEAKYKDYYQKNLSDEYNKRLNIIGFTDRVYMYSGASDVVVTRAGATNLAEFAVQNKACIIVPGVHLSSGHQIENAKILADKNAALLIGDKDISNNGNRLATSINELLNDGNKRKQLEKNINYFAKPNSSEVIAKKLIEISKNEA